MSEKEKVPLRKRKWFIILFLIIFFPVGLYLMWRHANWSKTAKWVVTGVIAVLAAYSLGTQDTTTNVADNTNSTEVADESETSTDTATEENTEAEEIEKTEPAEDVEEEVETETGEQEETASEDEEVVEEEEAEQVVGIGETLTIDDIDFVVNGLEQRDVVGTGLSATANDTYLVLDVSVTNNKNEAVTFTSSYFKIVDGETVYEPDPTASTYRNQELAPDNTGLLIEEINPGSSRDAFIVYDVAPGVIESSTKQLQVQSGFWGTETGIINLQ